MDHIFSRSQDLWNHCVVCLSVTNNMKRDTRNLYEDDFIQRLRKYIGLNHQLL